MYTPVFAKVIKNITMISKHGAIIILTLTI